MVFAPHYLSILDQRRLALQSELARFLPAPAPLVLEVGCGHGHFLTAYATAHPDQVCVGIDLIGERIDRARKKRDRARLGHLHFIQTEARLFLETLPPETALGAVYLLFPDPWPKARHNKHRILQPEFLRQLARHAVPDCPLYFRTDFTPYFESAREVIQADPYWRLGDEPWPFEYETVFQRRAPAYASLVARRRGTPELAKDAAAPGNGR